MNRVLIISSVLIIFWITGALSDFKAGDQQDLDSAVHFLIHQNYTDAQLLQKYTSKNPTDNEALYLSFVIDQTRILDYGILLY